MAVGFSMFMMLANDSRRAEWLWREDAERLRALTMGLALRRAELVLGPTLGLPDIANDTGPPVRYEVAIQGASVETLPMTPEIS